MLSVPLEDDGLDTGDGVGGNSFGGICVGLRLSFLSGGREGARL